MQSYHNSAIKVYSMYAGLPG